MRWAAERSGIAAAARRAARSRRARAGAAAALVVAAAVVLLGPVPAWPKQRSAVREFVLKQIRLPHHYYYREMFLPQATDGPSSVAWLPDGRELVYSMQGTLWRQRPGTTSAVQLTAGDGYDYQPDVSPDGRHVAFARYRDDAVELVLLDLESGATRALTQNGAVNVEPRWSPDGTQLAFTSTLHEGRFHIFLLELNGAAPGEPRRLTEDHDSGLPRYYYAAYDHFISPAWSPDGREILFVSNRGRIWGTGGIWRMEARPGARAREVHFEETTWKARPDWARDGRRVVYASYLGRQWHQLWLMTADGGDVFPLTYGEFDAAAPRWSPDGRRIAYVSNEDGGTALRIVEIPGGKVERVTPKDRRYLRPMGRLRLEIVEAAGGRTAPARVAVTGSDALAYSPDDAWRHADEAFDRSERRYEYAYFHTPGVSTVTVPAGHAVVEVIRGLEFEPAVRSVEVPAGGTRTVRVALRRLADMPARGWRSGDLHVHMNYGGAYRNTPRRLLLQAAAEDLHVVENLIVNKEQRIPDIAVWSGRPDPVSTAERIIAHAQEYHTSFWGHAALLGLRDHFLLPDYAAYVNTAAASLYPDNAAVFDLAHAQGAVTALVHPFDTIPDPAAPEALTHELPVVAALGAMDYFEVVGFSDHLATAQVWYRLLNCGFRIPAGAGTDAMANYASLRGPIGVDRVYVRTGPRFDHDAFLAGLKAGRTFATNGPLLQFTLGGRGPGEELRLPPGGREVALSAWMRSIVPVEHLEVVAGGRVIADLETQRGGTSADASRTIRVEKSGWYTLRARAEHPAHPVLDIYPFATTSPVYVRVGEDTVSSAEDAAYFSAWIERLETAVRAHEGWNDLAEKDAILAKLGRARAVFAAMVR